MPLVTKNDVKTVVVTDSVVPDVSHTSHLPDIVLEDASGGTPSLPASPLQPHGAWLNESPTGKARVQHLVQEVRSEASGKSVTSSSSKIKRQMSSKSVSRKQLQESVRQSIAKVEYDVKEYYYDTGVFQQIARHSIFDNAILVVIAMNSVWIAVDTDLNDAQMLTQAQIPFQLAEHFFCLVFSFEWVVRFMSFRNKCFPMRDKWCYTDFWFIFDSALVLLMVLETWVMTWFIIFISNGSSPDMGNTSMLRVARLLRLTRMARMGRLLRRMPELVIMIKGIAAAMRSVCITLCLLIMLLYMFGIAFAQLTAGSDIGKQKFDTVLGSMYSLLIDGTLMDNLGETVRQLGEESPLCVPLWWLFVLMSSLTVMNMLIGVLCEVVSSVAEKENEDMRTGFVTEKMKQLFGDKATADDGTDLISRDDFLEILKQREAARLLDEVGVDVISLIDAASSMFQDDDWFLKDEGAMEPEQKKLTFKELIQVILSLRASNKATVKDMVEMRKKILEAIDKTNKKSLDKAGRISGRDSGRAVATTSDPGEGRLAENLGTGADTFEDLMQRMRAEYYRVQVSEEVRETKSLHSIHSMPRKQTSASTGPSIEKVPTERLLNEPKALQENCHIQRWATDPHDLDTSRFRSRMLEEVGLDVRRIVQRLEGIVLDAQCQVKEEFAVEGVGRPGSQDHQSPWGSQGPWSPIGLNASAPEDTKAHHVCPPGFFLDGPSEAKDLSSGTSKQAAPDPGRSPAGGAGGAEWVDLQAQLAQLVGALDRAAVNGGSGTRPGA